MDCFLEKLRTFKAKRVELSRALHLLGTDLAEIEQKVLSGQRSIRIHPDVIPKAIMFEDAAKDFQEAIREALKTGLLLDAQEELDISA